MKKVLVTIACLIISTAIFAQRFAVVDTEYILSNIPEYEIAQERLNDLAIEWQKEIEKKFAEIEKLYQAYQAEAVLLPADMKKKREDEIIQKEKEAKELQRKRFGSDGDLTQRRRELVKPIQDRIYNAIEEIANRSNFAVVFDKAGGLSMLYVNPRNDISDDVLQSLGHTN